MKKILLVVFFISSILFSHISFANTNSPIVQIVAYDDIYGKYYQMIWWWSASLLDDKWNILTNNHVVDNGKGGAYSLFNICISIKENEKPHCHYTATLIERDIKKDIAFLRINPRDIYGNKVDFASFSSINPDFEYIPKSWESIEAIWFPWVWSETITKTQGIVSGTSEYNDATYIKTDTLIAGWNSGWAFVKNGKLIWVPTFWIGGFMDASLGYGLLISEARDFIITNQAKQVSSFIQESFHNYRKNIEDINLSNRIDDSFLSINFWEEYKVSDYVAWKSVTFEPEKPNEELPQSIVFQILDLPSIKTQDEFLYVLQDLLLYSKEYQKLKKLKISGIDFYQPISNYDLSWWNTSGQKSYYAQIGGNLVIISGNLWYNSSENIIKEVSKAFDTFINKVSLNVEWIKKTTFSINYTNPSFRIAQNTKSVYVESMGGATIYPFGNLHEYIGIFLQEHDIYSGKWQSIDSIYESETKDISIDMKSKILFKWHEWYITCSDSANISKWIQTDEKGNYLNQSSCSLKIFWIKANEKEYVIFVNLLTNKKNIKNGLNSLIKTLPSILFIETLWEGKTEIKNLYKSDNSMDFKDLKDQSEGYKSKLKTLIKYGIIENSEKFEPYKAMKWGEYIDMYLTNVYKIDLNSNICKKGDSKCRLKNYKITIGNETKSVAYFLDLIGIRSDNYVDSSKIYTLNDVLDLIILARLDPKVLTEEWLAKYSARRNTKEFEEITTKVQEWFFNLYGQKKISYYEMSGGSYDNSFWTNKYLYFSETKWIIENSIYLPWRLDFSKRNKDFNTDEFKLYYPVLTKAEAIDQIVNLIDFWLFDPELAKKKDTNIEE